MLRLFDYENELAGSSSLNQPWKASGHVTRTKTKGWLFLIRTATLSYSLIDPCFPVHHPLHFFVLIP
jgi:hypothetical protein